MEFFLRINDIVIETAPVCEMDFQTFWEGDMWKLFSKYTTDQNKINHIDIISGSGKKYSVDEFLNLIKACNNKYWQT